MLLRSDHLAHGNAEITSGEHLSFWTDSTEPIAFSKVTEDLKTDVVIVGAGIAGLTTAYLLTKEGKKVIVVDDGNVGSGESGRTTAHLVTALDDRYMYLEKYHGEKGAKLAAESHRTAIDKVEEIVTKEKMDCEFKRLSGYLFLHPHDKLDNLTKEFEALKRVNLECNWLEFIPGFSDSFGPCIEFLQQAQFHPMKYLRGLCKAIIKHGGEIYTDTHITEVTEKEVKTATDYHITAKHIVVATNSPINDYYAMHYKQYPYRTYVIAAPIPKGKAPYALWWDTGDQDSKWITKPYHYVRLTEYSETHDLIISGGEDHRTGQNEDSVTPEQRYKNLELWTRNIFPSMGKPIYSWSGQVEEPLDSLAFIGRNPGDKNIYIATGDSGNGMTHGTIAGMLITDLIIGKENPWEKLYDPSRKKLRTAADFAIELEKSVVQYVGDLVTREVSSHEDLPVGEGGILGIGLNKTAVFREAENTFHAFSALCPHQKCILEWNSGEKSFDCPCHGSRFTAYGKIMNGPALTDLKPVALPETAHSH
jgi:glycine/D-amino acid oxidase-like deaminating enzyme/nitrite reductase/ring-hydroxylating ferredoxin subunit